VLVLIGATLLAVALRAETGAGITTRDLAALRFTLVQALLSAAFSVLLAVPVARALARRAFPGRGLFIGLLGAPFILPTIVAILGLLAVFGQAGLLNRLGGAVGLPRLDIYGLHGVVLAHVFFNLPLATRLILQGWLSVPAERFRLAASLGMEGRAVARHLEWPVLRDTLPGAFVAIFAICLTSFAVALTLGGGPRATTVELAIYQAFRFDFDLGRAARLALVQLALCAAGAVLALRVARAPGLGAGLDRLPERWDGTGTGARLVDTFVLVALAAFLLPPLVAILLRGLPMVAALPESVWLAAGRSVLVAVVSSVLCTLLGFAMALGLARKMRGRGFLEALGYLPIAASPLVLGAGLYILLFPVVNPVAVSLPVVALVNALMALPFCLRMLVPAARDVEAQFGRLAAALDLSGLARLRFLEVPRMRRALGFSAGLAAALSMGDLGVIMLFGDPRAATLPMMLYQLMGAYRMAEAAGAALLLVALAFGLFWAFDRGGRVGAAT